MILSLRSWLRRTRASNSTPTRRAALKLENLEDRTTPSGGSSGGTAVATAPLPLPWSDPQHLTLSLVPDGTSFAGVGTNLFASLQSARPDWEREILRAFQSWAVLGNLNIGLTADSGQALGAGGSSQGDARFGDIRVGGIAMTGETLGAAVMPGAELPGTWVGDVLLNTALRYSGAGSRDLYTIALHEAGHALGLDHSTLAGSVMNDTLGRAFTGPGSTDAANLIAVYGTRAPDRWDARIRNDTLRTATRLDTSGGFNGSTPLVTFGDVGSKDVDYYALPPLAGYNGPVTFRLQSAGRSLLAPKLTVVDAAGRVLGTASSAGPGGDTVEVHLNSVSPTAAYYLRVEGATKDVFAIGGYSLAVMYDKLLTTPADRINAVVAGPYENLSASELIGLLKDPGHQINNDHHTDDTLLEAAHLTAAPGFMANTHYQMLGSIGNAADVDSYRVRAPSAFPGAKTGVLTATVWTREPNGVAPQVKLFDRDLLPVAAQVVANGDGTFSVQATGLRGGRDYTVQVYSPDGSATGNYSVTMDYGTRVANLSSFASGDLTPAAPTRSYNLYVAKTQLFALLLSAQGGPVRMTIADANGATVGTLTAGPGQTVSGPGLLLKPGRYRVTFQSLGDGTTLPPHATYTVLGSSMLDGIGPLAADPTTQVQFIKPGSTNQFLYPTPTPVVTTSPFLWSLLVF